jgi:hypothetical protein
MTHGTQSHPRNRRATTATAALLALVVAGAPAYAARPNFGLYVSNYVMLVPSNAPFLIHPTGEYVDYEDPKQWKKAAYEPSYRETDDMDAMVLDMRDRGYVMIGYSAFGSNEADTTLQDDMRAMSPEEQLGYKIGLRMRGIKVNADPLGDPLAAARWANAEVVFVQKNYAFTRKEIQKDRIVTDDGSDTTTFTGRTNSGYVDQQNSRTDGYSNTQGQSDTQGRFDESHWNVGAKAGYEGGLGGGPSVEGSADYGEDHGTSSSNTKYSEQTKHGQTTQSEAHGGSYADTDDTTTHDTKHWATALIDRHVDHYEYMVTFWKRADPSRVTLGAITEPAPRALWAQLGTRHARVVSAVIGGSPAYLADIWEGDVLLAIEGQAVAGEEGLGRLLDANAGREVTLTVWRTGQLRDLSVPLNDPAGD